MKPGGKSVNRDIVEVQLVITETVREPLEQPDGRVLGCALMVDVEQSVPELSETRKRPRGGERLTRCNNRARAQRSASISTGSSG